MGIKSDRADISAKAATIVTGKPFKVLAYITENPQWDEYFVVTLNVNLVKHTEILNFPTDEEAIVWRPDFDSYKDQTIKLILKIYEYIFKPNINGFRQDQYRDACVTIGKLIYEKDTYGLQEFLVEFVEFCTKKET